MLIQQLTFKTKKKGFNYDQFNLKFFFFKKQINFSCRVHNGVTS